jgi:hypothetical protein
MRPAVFRALATVAAILVGLVLALVPVRVAGLDTTRSSTVTCGNAIGGVETKEIAAGLPNSGRGEVLEYVEICERAVSERETAATVLFFGGLVAALWLGVVRRRAPAHS